MTAVVPDPFWISALEAPPVRAFIVELARRQSLDRACEDAELNRHPNAFRIFRHLVPRLDFVQFHGVKLYTVQRALVMAKPRVIESLRTLRRLTYLQRGELDREMGIYTYRLLWVAPRGSENVPTDLA